MNGQRLEIGIALHKSFSHFNTLSSLHPLFCGIYDSLLSFSHYERRAIDHLWNSAQIQHSTRKTGFDVSMDA